MFASAPATPSVVLSRHPSSLLWRSTLIFPSLGFRSIPSFCWRNQQLFCNRSSPVSVQQLDGFGMDYNPESMDAARIVRELRNTFRSGLTRSVEWRLMQLRSILKLTQEREGDIKEALAKDGDKCSFEAFAGEIFVIISSCKLALKELKKWTAPQKVSTTLATYPSTGAIISEPLGVALVISAWNYPFSLSLEPVIGAIAAGNAVVLKPSELAPATSSLLAELIPLYLDTSAIRVVEGGVPETTALLEQRWDKIFYTGNPRIARIVMTAAAKHLTPVTLELGGKCPVIIDATADLNVAAKRIASGKWGLHGGQACIAADYILAENSIASSLIDKLKVTIQEFYGKDPSKSSDLSRIVNTRHFCRLTELLDDIKTSDKIVHGGERDEKRLYIAPTILHDVSIDSPIMAEEIFGPLLPVLTVDSIDEALELVNSRPKPLALYLFTNKKDVKEKVIAETSSGGILINDCFLHFTNSNLPFGGVGESGMGAYHGKFSFDTFTHKKALLSRSFGGENAARYPPYTASKEKLVKCLLEGDYFGLVLFMLGLKS
ncbi:hypothetical protein O6H91_22G031100 [Diphasiastrum complanatum]|uniref:Uncharacterized protein n=1 Tax=Diphasiastrum complanatum TaxID=34168 RepID=A0ACC2AE47_DIPCM|nr:hypothetical protein O6H91_22G031100 [Diphasiastrum complanatum]